MVLFRWSTENTVNKNVFGFTSITLICETLLAKNASWIKMMTAFLSLTEIEAQILVVSVVNSKILRRNLCKNKKSFNFSFCKKSHIIWCRSAPTNILSQGSPWI